MFWNHPVCGATLDSFSFSSKQHLHLHMLSHVHTYMCAVYSQSIRYACIYVGRTRAVHTERPALCTRYNIPLWGNRGHAYRCPCDANTLPFYMNAVEVDMCIAKTSLIYSTVFCLASAILVHPYTSASAPPRISTYFPLILCTIRANVLWSVHTYIKRAQVLYIATPTTHPLAQ